MKINFDYPTRQLQVSHHVALTPGENELPDEVARDLIASSDALVKSIAKVKNISEDEVRKQRKGKGLFTAIESPTSVPAMKKREKGGEK